MTLKLLSVLRWFALAIATSLLAGLNMLTVSLFANILLLEHYGFMNPLHLIHPLSLQVSHSQYLALTSIVRFMSCFGIAVALTLLSFYLFQGWICTITQVLSYIIFETANTFLCLRIL